MVKNLFSTAVPPAWQAGQRFAAVCLLTVCFPNN
jgi:hypothetical protein